MLPTVRLSGTAAALVALVGPTWTPAPPAEPPAGLSAEDAGQIDRDLKELEVRLRTLRSQGALTPEREDLLADAEVFRKGVQWVLRYEAKLEPADVALLKKALKRGAERADALAAGEPAWLARKGKLVRGFVSAVDGSVQPYGLVIPVGYDPARPTRLDVVLHGSTKPTGLSELRFMARFDEGDGPVRAAPNAGRGRGKFDFGFRAVADADALAE
jgi:hypothetical protein